MRYIRIERKIIVMKNISMILMAFSLIFSACNAQNQSEDHKSEQQTQENKTQQQTIFKNVNVEEFKDLVNKLDNEIVLDVRTPDETSQGMVPNAQHIDFYAANFKDELKKLDKNKPVLVYCAAGGRSAQAQSMMKDMGFKEVYNLEGGYTAWKAAGN